MMNKNDKDPPKGPNKDNNSRSVQTECAGSEPYYSVPVLQNEISPAPGFTSRLYSVQVMSHSELETMTQLQRQAQDPRRYNQVSNKFSGQNWLKLGHTTIIFESFHDRS